MCIAFECRSKSKRLDFKRHARASHLLENKVVNIAQLSKIMGHEQLATTMIYLDVITDMKARAMMEMEDPKMRSIPRKWSDY